MEKHTPTPWMTENHEIFQPEPTHAGKIKISKLIARIIVREKSHLDAAFIVRACNEFDSLISALETAETYFDQYAAETPASAHTLVHIRKALAKTKGE